MNRLLTVLMWVVSPLVVLSMLFGLGLGMGAAFVVDFVVENQAAEVIHVTPVGTVGRQAHKHPLPVKQPWFPHWPARQLGAFRLGTGESVTIHYDMDDINFSELVVLDRQGVTRQLVVDPNPTARQYHSPDVRRFVIDDLGGLAPVATDVQDAARRAAQPSYLGWYVAVVLWGPAVLWCLLAWLRRLTA